MGLIVGVTATQYGLTREQLAAVDWIAKRWPIREFHDGDCIEGDWASNLVMRMHGVWTVGHPPDKKDKRAFGPHDEWWPEEPYRVRNRKIVEVSQCMVVLPRGAEWSNPYSGTWATQRLAVQLGRPVFLVMPDGTRERR